MNDYSTRLRFRLGRLLPDDLDNIVTGKDTLVCERISRARKSFLAGYHKALHTNRQELPFLINDWTGNSKGFALEGAAMAVTLIDELDRTNHGLLNALLSARVDDERMLCAIGIGWASARLRYPIQWAPPGVFSQHELLAIIDGYGFHQGFFGIHKPKGSNLLKCTIIEHEAYYNGIGRSIWFTCHGQIDKIHNTIAKYPSSDITPLWSGVGIACAFTGNTDQLSKVIDNSHYFGITVHEGAKRGTRLLNSLIANPINGNKSLTQ